MWKVKRGRWYFIIKNQEFRSVGMVKKLVSQSMLIRTLKVYTAACGINNYWINCADLYDDEKKNDITRYEKTWSLD